MPTACMLDAVFPAIVTDIQIDVRMAREYALTVSITPRGTTVSAARRVTMGTPSSDTVVPARVLTPTALPLAVS